MSNLKTFRHPSRSVITIRDTFALSSGVTRCHPILLIQMKITKCLGDTISMSVTPDQAYHLLEAVSFCVITFVI